jgi:dTDP-4-dehydrorhamnose reductase
VSPPRRWLITGGRGQLGTDLQAAVGTQDEILAVDVDELDITDAAAVDALVGRFEPSVVVNAAAYTAVDAAEANEDLAYRVNATGPAHLALAAHRFGARLVHVSTDYVFAGDATVPYEVTDIPDPRSAYGRTKLAGELAVRDLLPHASYVVRTAWVYGPGTNFVATMKRLERERETVEVVDDQRGSPTWSRDLASGLVELARSGAHPGIYHCTNSGTATWFELAQAVFGELGAATSRVERTTTEAFRRAAHRPAYSVLSDASWRSAGLTPLPHWRDALHRAFAAGTFDHVVTN